MTALVSVLGVPFPRAWRSLAGFVGMLLIVAIALFQAGCAQTPLALATTTAQRYDAIRLTYDALLTPAQKFVQDETLPLDARRNVQRLVATSGELYERGSALYAEYLIARAEVRAGESPQAKLDIVSGRLEQWFITLEMALQDLAKAL